MERTQVEPGVVRGGFWRPIEAGRRVECELCPRACKLQPGQRGFCFVRKAGDVGIDLTSYGRASGFCVDPIEKKPLNHFYPGTSVLSFGTAGCNLGCKFCQNWDISKARELDRLSPVTLPGAVARAAQRAGCKSLAFTYNDPVIFAEYAIDCAEAAHELGLKTVAVTAGYIGRTAREAFFAPMDAVNVDLKAFSETFYRSLCFAELAPVLDTLIWLKRETDVWLEVTTLLIPGQNDSDAEISRLSEWFVEQLGPDTPLHFSAFHPDFKLRDLPPTPPQTVLRARELAKAAGIRHVYTGNIRDVAGQASYCAGCGAVCIARDGYRVGRFDLDAVAACKRCGARLPGHFERTPGQFGSRRIPLTIAP
ncbi:MAG TPA: AmmeMemoRadiSam system radical SAM enzyme [Polyangiales bacterium]|nr:AmmeMemoRadiSam system radical SAM enzyme [Polyangiales bacterium]